MKTRETQGERRATTAAVHGRSSAQRDSKPHTEAGDLLPAWRTRSQLTRGAERPLPCVTHGPSKSLPQVLHPQRVSAFCFILLPEPSAMSHCTARRIIPNPRDAASAPDPRHGDEHTGFAEPACADGRCPSHLDGLTNVKHTCVSWSLMLLLTRNKREIFPCLACWARKTKVLQFVTYRNSCNNTCFTAYSMGKGKIISKCSGI